jgi:alkanesulfonate monooxygenase SsuD/methylene tetrahydromethanopterin reductase-like flavin-dependent oxidoreductase (luciferase family)
MGAYGGTQIEPIRGSAEEVAEHLSAFAAAGADHVQLVVDPITRDSIEWFEAMFAALDGGPSVTPE